MQAVTLRRDIRAANGRLFIEVFDEEATKLKDVAFLAQGTIYPDVIESAGGKTGKAHVIKSHHNVGGLPEHEKTLQAFAVFLPVKSVGVTGDGRRHDPVIAL